MACCFCAIERLFRFKFLGGIRCVLFLSSCSPKDCNNSTANTAIAGAAESPGDFIAATSIKPEASDASLIIKSSTLSDTARIPAK